MRDLRQLQCFRSVALIGSVRGGAERLGAAPSAVSQQIRALEKELGLDLFSREGRRLTLTAVGREMLVEAERVFEALGALEDRAGELREQRSQRLVIGYFSSAGARWIADLVAYLEFSHPDLSVRLELTDGGLVEDGPDLQLLVTGDDDLALPDQMGSELLLDDPYVAAVPRGHALAEREEVTLAELTVLPWIDNDDLTSDGRCRQVFVDGCRAAGVDVAFRHQAHDYRTALEMVDRGLGATVLPRLGLVGAGEDTAVLRIVDPPLMRRIHLARRLSTSHPVAIDDARRALQDLVAQDAAAGSPPR